jgi:hypothetical protein
LNKPAVVRLFSDKVDINVCMCVCDLLKSLLGLAELANGQWRIYGVEDLGFMPLLKRLEAHKQNFSFKKM